MLVGYEKSRFSRNSLLLHRSLLNRRVLVELFDVECYRDLEMWVRGHSRSLKRVPFKSLGTVFYSPFIVTMAVTLAISDIFYVKIWVCGRSTSPKMARFDRDHV